MRTYVYRCSKKPDMYIYLAKKDNFSKLPEGIVNSLGIIEFSMELEVTTDTKLARENSGTIIENLASCGFHIQLPKETSIEELMAKISRNKRV
jgi:uncharacterized protein YcgL (UPF0745 family)